MIRTSTVFLPALLLGAQPFPQEPIQRFAGPIISAIRERVEPGTLMRLDLEDAGPTSGQHASGLIRAAQAASVETTVLADVLDCPGRHIYSECRFPESKMVVVRIGFPETEGEEAFVPVTVFAQIGDSEGVHTTTYRAVFARGAVRGAWRLVELQPVSES